MVGGLFEGLLGYVGEVGERGMGKWVVVRGEGVGGWGRENGRMDGWGEVRGFIVFYLILCTYCVFTEP